MRGLWARLQGLCSGIPFSPGQGGRTGAVDATAQPPRVGTLAGRETVSRSTIDQALHFASYTQIGFIVRTMRFTTIRAA